MKVKHKQIKHLVAGIKKSSKFKNIFELKYAKQLNLKKKKNETNV
jgi:hypothetical protein